MKHLVILEVEISFKKFPLTFFNRCDLFFLINLIFCLKEEFGKDEFDRKELIVIFAGAALGEHLALLPVELFPQIKKLILYDCQRVFLKLGENPKTDCDLHLVLIKTLC